jgi:hypothetical protein
MSNWRSAGHSDRRRGGSPSSHMDSLGSIGARVNLPTPEEAIAGMARVGSPRVPMGNSAITEFANAKSIPPLRGTLVPRGNAAAGDMYGPTGSRGNVMQESLGASYRVSAFTPPMTSPEAGATQANGRIVPSAAQRMDSFADGINGAYAGY